MALLVLALLAIVGVAWIFSGVHLILWSIYAMIRNAIGR